MAHNLQIIGLGMCTLDVLIRCTELPTWERGGTRIKALGFDGGGPVGTAMVAAARLGARVGFIGSAGNDAPAEFKLRSMRDCGVDLSRMVYRDAPEDQLVVVNIHAETGERIFSGVQRWGEGQIRPEELDREYITAADYLHLDGYHNAAALQAARWMKAAGKIVSLDGHKTDGPVGEHLRRLLPYVDVLISGSGFARGLTGIADLWEAGAAILTLGPRIFVQTEGMDGSYTITADEQFHTPAFPVQVIDTTGAGDVFHGAYLVGLLHGWNLRQIALFATAVSALKCTRLGGRGGIPDFPAVMTFLRERGVVIE
ncbi:MAG TPA: carbohydrate kinase family protein [Anaerolineae bacterium]|nr:carbohydrate kinase family protein [Anaerolineae bacterium]HQK14876.1 carbohydrate kinase family protein [Anaerolineae bacterium]